MGVKHSYYHEILFLGNSSSVCGLWCLCMRKSSTAQAPPPGFYGEWVFGSVPTPLHPFGVIDSPAASLSAAGFPSKRRHILDQQVLVVLRQGREVETSLRVYGSLLSPLNVTATENRHKERLPLLREIVGLTARTGKTRHRVEHQHNNVIQTASPNQT